MSDFTSGAYKFSNKRKSIKFSSSESSGTDSSDSEYNYYSSESDVDYCSDSSTNKNKVKSSKKVKLSTEKAKEELQDLKKDSINNCSAGEYESLILEELKELNDPETSYFKFKQKCKTHRKYLSDLKYSSGLKVNSEKLAEYLKTFDLLCDLIQKSSTKSKFNLSIWIKEREIKYYEKVKKEKEDKNKTKHKEKTEDLANLVDSVDSDKDIYELKNNYPMIFPFMFGGLTGANAQPLKKLPQEEQKLQEEYEKLSGENSGVKTGTEYFMGLSLKDKVSYIEKLREIKKHIDYSDTKPNSVRVLETEMSNKNKLAILSKINTYEKLSSHSSDNSKFRTWIETIMKVPFGKYASAPVSKSSGSEKIKNYLQTVKKNLDADIYGHETTKHQLIKILAHTIANPQEGGNIFALQGPPGVGKTALIQDGVSKALGRPFTFICLGGATDSAFLEGFDYTYEGSTNGRIVDLLIEAKCMNPVIYFDELDKVSETPKGDEIINILMHITDSTQNSHFNDKYFAGIDFDLSKAIIIFSFNDEQKISRILRDRMKIINVKGYKEPDKILIAQQHLIPKLIKQIGLDLEVKFTDDIIEYLISSYTNEGGVRKLKELLTDILLELNLMKLKDDMLLNKKIDNKINITQEMIEKVFLKNKIKVEHVKINPAPSIGQVAGLWASAYGVGGLVPIECSWIPSTKKLKLLLTGMQGEVMRESMTVAKTVAWKLTPENVKIELNKKWENTCDYGIHVHCPDGSTPKDGPSAGGAITTSLVSLLTGIPVLNTVAMTGEINLKGQITKIGGLEEKIFGAKKAGALKVLCPLENKVDLDEIIHKFPSLIDENFTVETVETIWDILDKVLVKKLPYTKF
jgi:endopeptidase La